MIEFPHRIDSILTKKIGEGWMLISSSNANATTGLC
jgi:hypothetical protein